MRFDQSDRYSFRSKASLQLNSTRLLPSDLAKKLQIFRVRFSFYPCHIWV